MPRISFLFLLFSFFAQAQVSTIYFDVDDFSLSDSAKTVLVKMSRTIDKQEELVIYCYCDSSGSVEYNQTLSENRANTVKGLLQKIGNYNFTNAEIIGFGKLKPTYNNQSKDRFKNRRCDVFLKKNIKTVQSVEVEKNELAAINLEEGVVVSLPNFEFVGNQTIPLWSSMQTLEDLYHLMRIHPDLEIELRGHVCCDHNQTLSEGRAEIVYDYLVSNGIKEERLSFKGFSNTIPLVEETSERNEQKNRRTEIRVVKESSVEVEDISEPKSKIEILVRGVYFEKYESYFYNGSAFNLEIIMDMIQSSKGYYYVFNVYERDGDMSLSNRRKKLLSQVLYKNKCKANQFKVVAKGQHPEGLGDVMSIEIIKR